jgi:ABC-2 type transport system ATP-binding protein
MMFQLENVYKSYFRTNVLSDINLTIKPGMLVGLLGPNGAGKTSLLKLMLRYTKPTKGQLIWNNKPLSEESMNDIAGCLDFNPFPFWMSMKDVKEFYEYYFKDFDTTRFNELMDYLKLEPKKKIVHCSKGTIGKIKLLFTLSRRAKLYLLDEPLEGLDIVARKKYLEVIVETFNPECAMIISSHYVDEMEQLFTDAIFLSEGKIVLNANTETLRSDKQKSIDAIYMEMFAPCGN